MLPRLVTDAEQYAKLLLSVGQQGRNIKQKRPLRPVECAELIKRLMNEEGDNLTQVTERLDLGRTSGLYQKRDTTQVGHFLKLLDFSEKSRHLAGWYGEPPPTVPFSTMVKLLSLSPAEQDIVVQSVYKNGQKQITKDDAIHISKWRRTHPDRSINECIEKIFQTKPITKITYVVVCEIRNWLKQFIVDNFDFRSKMLVILHKKLPGTFYNIDATDTLITISMNATAYKIFYEEQHKKNNSFTNFLNNLMETNNV